MAIGVGQRCVVRIQITDINLRNAKDIKAIIVSPQGEEKCQDVSFDEVSGVVYVSVEVNSVGSWAMWLGVRYDKELFYTPSFVFAEVEGDAKPCDAPYIVDVEVQGESVSVTPPKVDVDVVTREEFEQLSNKVEDLESQIGSGGGGSASDNNYTDADKELVQSIPTLNKNVAKNTADIKIKQDTLTLTTKSNGNIVIGNLAGQSKEFMPATPSGDPMHYAYEAVGAVWNANTGYWEFYDMKDITNIEMSRAFARGSWYIGSSAIGALSAFNEQASSAIRFNIARTGPWSVSCDFDYFAQENKWIEFINLTFDNNLVSKPLTYASYLTGSFSSCSNLRRIYGELNVSDTNNAFTDTFKGCVKLKDVEIYGLNKDISFADSPLLSKESLLYMISNCASGVSFTITLHPDVYVKCTDADNGEWYDDVVNAIDIALSNKGASIGLARA